jgi:hypothetical protein
VDCERLECGVDRELGGSEDREVVDRNINRELIGERG